MSTKKTNIDTAFLILEDQKQKHVDQKQKHVDQNNKYRHCILLDIDPEKQKHVDQKQKHADQQQNHVDQKSIIHVFVFQDQQNAVFIIVCLVDMFFFFKNDCLSKAS